MAITINYLTQVINVPQADLTFVSGTFYQLDIDTFRKALNDIADSEEGIPEPDTHIHNTEVTIIGTVFARQVIITNGYSVEFEDGQYTVELIGANTNVHDVAGGILVQNQVQVIPTNSAGLISGVAIEDLLTTIDSKIDLFTKLQRNKLVTDRTTGIATLFDDDGITPLLTAQFYETEDTSQTYRGQGSERRERFT